MEQPYFVLPETVSHHGCPLFSLLSMQVNAPSRQTLTLHLS